MLLEVFNSSTRVRNDIIKTYDYAQYVEEFNGEGSFQINIPSTEQSLSYLVFGNFILFEDGVVGIIKGIKDSEDDDTQMVITGKLSNHILSFRSIPRTERYSGTLTNNAVGLLVQHFLEPSDIFRRIGFLHLATDEKYLPDSEVVSICETGKTVLETISTMFLPYGYGFTLYPMIKNFDEELQNSNLEGFEFRVLKPADRTIGNTEGNREIVFSFELNNLERLEYDENGSDYASVALVASEGVGQYRKLIEVGELEKTGYDRIELYVDARDLQSEDTEGNTITEEELEAQMEQRGLEKLEEHKTFIAFDGNVIVEGNNRYVYKQDFFLGDYVTVQSKRLNKFFNVQIVSVTKTVSGGVEYFDVGFGYDSLSVARVTKTNKLYSEKVEVKGDKGDTPSVTIGTVTTGEVPLVYDTGTNGNVELNFVFPSTAVTSTGTYTFSINSNTGNLIMESDTESALDDFSVNSNGELVYNGTESTFTINSKGYLIQN